MSSRIRNSIRDYLELVADLDRQWKEGPVEIFCMWFDDLYFPAFNPKSFNPGVFQQGLKEFEASFSAEELRALRDFHAYFESIHEMNIDKPFEEIQKDPNWIELAENAKKTVAALGA